MAEEQGGPDHLSLAVGSGRPVSVGGEQQVHAQLAAQRPGEYYLRQARARLEASGIPSAQVDYKSIEKSSSAAGGRRPNRLQLRHRLSITAPATWVTPPARGVLPLDTAANTDHESVRGRSLFAASSESLR
jgi:hypothetical protein